MVRNGEQVAAVAGGGFVTSGGDITGLRLRLCKSEINAHVA